MTQRPYQRHWKRKQQQHSTEQIEIPKEQIPTEAIAFYKDFGPFIHSKTNAIVEQPTWYQTEEWNDPSRYKLIIKSQKVGISSWELRHDFNLAITKCKGKDVLIIAQTQYAANEHLLTLKTDIINSEKYAKYLIRDPGEFLFREQKTKVREIQIKNPDNALRPSRIIALGASEGAVWSWKNVAHIHMSDIAANDLKDDAPLFGAAFSRLANTEGTMLIETPPRGPRGKVFEIYQTSLTQSQQPQEEKDEGKFKIFHVTAQDAVQAGLITQNFLEEEKQRLGALYAQYYEAAFISISGNLFSQSAIDTAVNKYQYNPDSYLETTQKYICADQGYISSKFAIIVAEWIPRIMKLKILVAEEHQMPTTEEMINRILVYRKRYGNVQNIGFDATSRMEFGCSLKQKIGEPYRIPYIKNKILQAKGQVHRLAHAMSVVPIIFSTESKDHMVNHTRRLLEDPREIIAIHPRFVNLITGLRSAVFSDTGTLDKDLSPHNDLTDTFMMLMEFLHFEQE